MKVKGGEEIFKKKPKPFLIFPLIDNKENLHSSTMPKNPGLKLFTKVRSSKIESSKEKERPLTATLEKPAVLDIKLISKIDMSTIRKEFLNITNLCRLPIGVKVRRKKQIVVCRPLSICAAEIASKKVKKIETNSDDSWEDEESMRSARLDRVSKTKLQSSNMKKPLASVIKKTTVLSDKNNNKSVDLGKKGAISPSSEIDESSVIKKDVAKPVKVPEPCKTCGRPNQPERFHSHPETPLKPLRKMEIAVKIPIKNTVTKPVAIKYKSKQPSVKKPLPIRKPSLPAQVLEHSPPATAEHAMMEPKPDSRVGSAKRTLTCYICGREFGTASLPLHEPKCLEKWERENKNLPPQLRRSAPTKPDPNCPVEEWNQKALEIFKSKLLPCLKCGRTFNPESLIVHQRSCKETQNTNIKLPIEAHNAILGKTGAADKPSTPESPLNIECSMCGKKFGSHSIKIHERQCLKKMQLETGNQSKVSRQGSNSTEAKPSPKSINTILSSNRPASGSRPSSERKPQIFPCYLCGKMFSIASIHIHEPHCLKMWRRENEKLPPQKRRDVPIKPEIKYTRDGKIDFEATTEDCWQTHLSQLVPCKLCSRKFNPDRVEIHERNCKGY